MNKILIVLLAVFIIGCTYKGDETLGSFITNPESWVKDSHYTQYQEKRDTLEGQYLDKEITYGEYVQQKRALDEKYDQEIQDRGVKANPSHFNK